MCVRMDAACTNQIHYTREESAEEEKTGEWPVDKIKIQKLIVLCLISGTIEINSSNTFL